MNTPSRGLRADARPSASKRGYNRRWAKARLSYLKQHPLCVYCERQGRAVPATVVDHITPHKGDQTLFWDKANWQGLCTTHHNASKQAEERSGVQLGAAADGLPLDPKHHWNT